MAIAGYPVGGYRVKSTRCIASIDGPKCAPKAVASRVDDKKGWVSASDMWAALAFTLEPS